MERATLGKVGARLGLVAVILLAPGGFILGATLAANHYRKRVAPARGHEPEAGDTPTGE